MSNSLRINFEHCFSKDKTSTTRRVVFNVNQNKLEWWRADLCRGFFLGHQHGTPKGFSSCRQDRSNPCNLYSFRRQKNRLVALWRTKRPSSRPEQSEYTMDMFMTSVQFWPRHGIRLMYLLFLSLANKWSLSANIVPYLLTDLDISMRSHMVWLIFQDCLPYSMFSSSAYKDILVGIECRLNEFTSECSSDISAPGRTVCFMTNGPALLYQ